MPDPFDLAAVDAELSLLLALLAMWFGDDVQRFCELLVTSGAWVLGSLPLRFLLGSSFDPSWTPDDVVIFLNSRNPYHASSAVVIADLLFLQGYVLTERVIGLDSRVVYKQVLTFCHDHRKVHVIIVDSPGSWPSSVLRMFDISCFCSAFDGIEVFKAQWIGNPLFFWIHTVRTGAAAHYGMEERILKYIHHGLSRVLPTPRRALGTCGELYIDAHCNYEWKFSSMHFAYLASYLCKGVDTAGTKIRVAREEVAAFGSARVITFAECVHRIMGFNTNTKIEMIRATSVISWDDIGTISTTVFYAVDRLHRRFMGSIPSQVASTPNRTTSGQCFSDPSGPMCRSTGHPRPRVCIACRREVREDEPFCSVRPGLACIVAPCDEEVVTNSVLGVGSTRVPVPVTPVAPVAAPRAAGPVVPALLQDDLKRVREHEDSTDNEKA